MQRLFFLVVSIWLALAGNTTAFFQSTHSPAFQLSKYTHPLTGVPAGFSVRFHPDGGLFVGDLVSFEIFYSSADANGPKLELEHRKVEVRAAGPDGALLGSAEFGLGALPGQFRASLQWAWDTGSLRPDQYTLTFAVPEDGISWDQTVTLGPGDAVPPPEPNALWAVKLTDCCIINYLTHTAAERDLDLLTAIANHEAQGVEQQFGKKIDVPFRITFLSRVLGHGGFTSNDTYVSYLDRNYAGSTVQQVLHHEMVHFVDAKLGGELRPDMLVEGLAVYFSGGHFKPDPLQADAAALVDMGWYIPLRALADSFYPSQHEIGYLEAAAFVGYLVNTRGWDGFSSFYRDIHPQASKSQSDAINAAMVIHFGQTFAQVEDGFLNYLRSQAVLPDIRLDIATTVRFYDTMRHYQQVMDPSAYFRLVWLPNSDEMRKRRIVADYLRHPDTPEHQELETLLIEAEADVRSGRYDLANQVLSAIEADLDARDAKKPLPDTADPILARQLEIVTKLGACGFEPQKIQVSSGTGRAEAIETWPELEVVPLMRVSETWQLGVPCRQPGLQPKP